MTIPKQLLEAKICNKNTCDLQDRINKAIDYIEHKANIKEYFMVNGKEYTELLGILKGSDNNA